MTGAEIAAIITAVLAGLAGLVTAIVGLAKTLSGNQKYADLLKRFRLLEIEHQRLNAAFLELTKLLGEDDKRIEELQREYDLLKGAYNALSDKYEMSQVNYRELQAKYDMLRCQYDQVMSEYEVLRKKVNGVEKRTGSLGGSVN